MVFVHGGGWRRGDKNGASVPQKVAFFTGRGWVFVSMNYRLIPDIAFAENVRDVARAIDWVFRNISQYGGDPGRNSSAPSRRRWES